MLPLQEKVDAVVALDVIEHIEPKTERAFLEAAINCLNSNRGRMHYRYSKYNG